MDDLRKADSKKVPGREGDRFPEGIALSALTRAPFSLVLTDASQEDNPIVYVNGAFSEVTGYGANSALGRNCRFLQGEQTDPEVVAELRKAIEEGREVTVELVNYRADGSPFRNRLMIAPLTGDDEGATNGRPRFFLGVQMARGMHEKSDRDRAKALDRALSEVQHRVKNHLSMIVSMIRLQARQDAAQGEGDRSYDALSRRIEALQLLYEEITKADAEAQDEPVDLGAYLSRVAAAISRIDGRPGVRCDVTTVRASVGFQVATQVGLLVSEVLTNALQHAFQGREHGLVSLRMEEMADGALRIVVSDDGTGIPEGQEWPEKGSLGSRIVSGLVSDLKVDLDLKTGDEGTVVALTLPEGTV
ncbi:MAG: PAS domain-containing protein [Hasllibacter sp.]